MKRFYAMILLLAVLFSASTAFSSADYWKFTNYGSTEGIEDLFDGDMFSLDLYMSPTDLTAWFIETTWKNGRLTTVTLRADIKSKTGDNHLYFVLENGYTIKGHYDQNGYDFWMDYDAGSIKLRAADEFIKGLNYIGGKYAPEVP